MAETTTTSSPTYSTISREVASVPRDIIRSLQQQLTSAPSNPRRNSDGFPIIDVPEPEPVGLTREILMESLLHDHTSSSEGISTKGAAIPSVEQESPTTEGIASSTPEHSTEEKDRLLFEIAVAQLWKGMVATIHTYLGNTKNCKELSTMYKDGRTRMGPGAMVIIHTPDSSEDDNDLFYMKESDIKNIFDTPSASTYTDMLDSDIPRIIFSYLITVTPDDDNWTIAIPPEYKSPNAFLKSCMYTVRSRNSGNKYNYKLQAETSRFIDMNLLFKDSNANIPQEVVPLEIH